SPFSPTSSFTVWIRDASITGGVLATSRVITIGPQPPSGPTRFGFSSTLSLTPGSRYVLQLVGDGMGWNIFHGSGAAYGGGNAIIGGSPSDDDLWFREGVVVPEPAISWFIWLAAIVLITSRSMRAMPLKRCRESRNCVSV